MDPEPAVDPAEAAFERYVEEALGSIPRPFADQLGSVAIVIEDEPTADQLAAARVHGLFGLYEGVPRTAYGADASPVPSKITLFRGPLQRHHPSAAALRTAVGETLLHEVAHHLGISDERLRELAAASRRGHR